VHVLLLLLLLLLHVLLLLLHLHVHRRTLLHVHGRSTLPHVPLHMPLHTPLHTPLHLPLHLPLHMPLHVLPLHVLPLHTPLHMLPLHMHWRPKLRGTHAPLVKHTGRTEIGVHTAPTCIQRDDVEANNSLLW
jgi:hypothetical protein